MKVKDPSARMLPGRFVANPVADFSREKRLFSFGKRWLWQGETWNSLHCVQLQSWCGPTRGTWPSLKQLNNSLAWLLLTFESELRRPPSEVRTASPRKLYGLLFEMADKLHSNFLWNWIIQRIKWINLGNSTEWIWRTIYLYLTMDEVGIQCNILYATRIYIVNNWFIIEPCFTISLTLHLLSLQRPTAFQHTYRLFTTPL